MLKMVSPNSKQNVTFNHSSIKVSPSLKIIYCLHDKFLYCLVQHHFVVMTSPAANVMHIQTPAFDSVPEDS